MYRVFFSILLLLFACVPEKASRQNKEQQCTFPAKKIIQISPVDTLFCNSTGNSDAIDITALYHAVNQNDIDWIKEEIARGANVNFRNPLSGSTPLIRSIFRNNIEIIALLLEHGAEPNIPRSDNGKTEASDGSTPLILAAQKGHAEIVQLLLEHGADPNIPGSDNGLTGSSDGATPLLLATQFGHIDVVQLLLQYGANPDKGDSDNGKIPQADGTSPLFVAVTKNNLEIARLLLTAGANPNLGRSDNGKSYTADGSTPLMYVAGQTSNTDMLRLLLKAGADPNLVNPAKGYTALDYAVNFGSPKVAKILREYGGHESLKASVAGLNRAGNVQP